MDDIVDAVLDDDIGSSGDIHLDGETGAALQTIGLIGDAVVLTQDAGTADRTADDGSIGAEGHACHIVGPRLGGDRVAEADDGVMVGSGQHIDGVEEIVPARMAREVEWQFVGIGIVAIGIVALGERTGDERAAIHLGIVGQIEAHIEGIAAIHLDGDGVALLFATRLEGDALLASESDGHMGHEEFGQRDGFGACEVGETEAQHRAAEAHADGITQREVLGIDSLTTVGNRGGSTPAGHPLVVIVGHHNFTLSLQKYKKILGICAYLPIFLYLCMRITKQNDMKRLLTMAVVTLAIMTASAQKGREKYEFMRNLPVYADSLIADMTFPLAWGNSDIKDFDEWRKMARQKVFDCMLMPPPAPANGYEVKVLFEEQREGYKARKIEIRLSKYYTVPAYVLIPDGKGPFPAINALHDHGAHLFIGKEKMIRPLACEDSTVIKDAEAWSAGYEGQFFGDYLAQNGYVVFSTDAPMWGERGQQEGPRRDRYDMIAGNMMMYGIDLSAWMTYDDIAATEYLATMPEVDAQRIGCTGWSMGAYRAWMLAALSDRIKVGASVCWMVTTDEQMGFKYKRTENGGFANCFPGLRRWMDYPHIASMACPKAMLFINGSQDKLFPVAGVEKAFRTMHDTWQSQGAGDKLETELWDMPHSCGKRSQQRVLDFFKKHL